MNPRSPPSRAISAATTFRLLPWISRKSFFGSGLAPFFFARFLSAACSAVFAALAAAVGHLPVQRAAHRREFRLLQPARAVDLDADPQVLPVQREAQVPPAEL